MADATSFTETKVRTGYTLRSPTNWTEVSKVLSLLQDALDGEAVYDNTVIVEAYDDEIRFYYEEKK